MSITKIITLVFLGIVLIVVGISSGKLWEHMDAHEIMVVQSPLSGELTFHTDAGGYKWQGFGKITTYPRRDMYTFRGVKIPFNDKANGYMDGSIQFEYPLKVENLLALHLRFGSREAVQKQLIETITDKSINMSGPLMTSMESAAAKRNALIQYVDDQIRNGVYSTRQKDVRAPDELTGKDKTVTIVEIVKDEKAAGGFARSENSVLDEFGLRPFNFVINEIKYDEVVQNQINAQQSALGNVQTAIANTRLAEQNLLTVKAEGEASAAKAKWAQEVQNAQAQAAAEQTKKVAELVAEQAKNVAVQAAEKELAVAKLGAEAAEETKRTQILLGQGESERRRLVMTADGALKQKLDAYVATQIAWAGAMKDFGGQLVPTVVMGNGGSSSNASTSMQDMMAFLSAKAARDIGLDLEKKD